MPYRHQQDNTKSFNFFNCTIIFENQTFFFIPITEHWKLDHFITTFELVASTDSLLSEMLHQPKNVKTQRLNELLKIMIRLV